MKLYKIIFKPFFYLLDKYIKSNRNWDFQRIKLGSELPTNELEALHAYRLSCYEKDSPYLIPKAQEELESEKAFDLNSFHIYAKDSEGNIIGSLRLLKRPFEMEKLSFSEEHKQGLDEYLEISRLVCSVRQKGLGRRLLIRAGIWSIVRTQYKGFTAICKCHRLPMFRRFGLIPKTSFKIQEREDQTYHLIRADFSEITMVTFKAFVTIQFETMTKLVQDAFSINRSAL